MDNPEANGKALDASAPSSDAQREAPRPPTSAAVKVDDSAAMANYANFCRVTATPEEMVIDFGLNSQPFGVPNEPIVASQRIVTNWYTAKRLIHALQLTLERHETTFGAIETDVRKRARQA
ncbi:MAG: DUF3467 domain-containing protein [Pirellulales bacterium]|nr:DUF3467 domain-containing protein [Pirellulales bacterium]